jgi:cellulase/cellobiase CelA1
MENPHIDWLAARSGSAAALAGAEVYNALGAGDNITYWSDVQDGTHCAVRPEWKTPLQQNLQKFLLKTGNAPGTIKISPLKQANLADWRTWQTPTLTDTPTTTPTTSTSPSPSAPRSTTPPPTGACTATYRTVNTWSGGFQGEFTVTAGTSPITAWTVTWPLTPGQTITQLRNGTPTTTASTETVRNTTWNGTLTPTTSTTFGYLSTGTPSTPAATCASP